ncbi:M48 family metallopeptidase [Halorubrum aidingense]|uniref:M48 family metallopeptidase n=1 Tax=Halorubrum aidingense TaxID=368623 RepID=UPI00138B1344|nr:YgjP-like metallopeptidase domain-containing protein [Halorubrum aidingense]
MSAERNILELQSGARIPYSVQQRNVKHPKLTLNPDGSLSVTVSSDASGRKIVAKNTGWISEKFDEQEESVKCVTEKYGDITSGFVFWGRKYDLERRTGSYDIHIKENTVRVQTPQSGDHLRFLLNQTREAVRGAVTTIADSMCATHNLTIERVTIRNQQTKWASCSSGHTLNFNLRSAFLPFDHLRYLVAHEVAHTRHPDHSGAFWDLVESMVPEYDRYRNELQMFWYALHRNEDWQKLLERA